MLLSMEKVPPELKLEQAKGLNMMMLVLNTLTSFKHNTQTGLLSPLTQIITDPELVKVRLLTTHVLSISDHVDTIANYTDNYLVTDSWIFGCILSADLTPPKS